MKDTFDDFVHDLQQQIYEEAKEAYGETAFLRWQSIDNMGSMENPDGFAAVRGVCGDTIMIYLKFENDSVTTARFETDGCGSSAICGSLAAEMSIGKTPDDLTDITGESILKRLPGFPKEEEHCAMLAAETLQAALHDYMIRNRSKD
jgi:nitrogen fixation NifU-like protein